MIAAHLDNLLFLLLVAVAVLFQFLAKTAAKAKRDQTKRPSTPIPRTPTPMRHAPTSSDEDRIRKLMEALGQPPTSRPPPPVVPRADIPPRPLAPVQPPTVYPPPPWKLTREERRKRLVILRENLQPRSKEGAEKISERKMTDEPAFEINEGPLSVATPIIKEPVEAYAATRTIGKTEAAKIDIATLLASTSGLRDAVILREILGPPRGLRAQMELSDGIA
jgi:hypothetical protein